MAEQEKKWKKAFLMAIVIGVLDILVLFLGTFELFHIAWSVGSIGVITFLGILMLVNYLSESTAFDKGEMRKAIAGSFIAVYFALVSLLTFTDFSPSDNTELAKTIIGHFTTLIEIIIVFYFVSSGVREYLKFKERRQNSKEEQKKPEEEQQQPVGEEK